MVQGIGGGDCHHQLFPHQSLPVRTLCVVGWLSFFSGCFSLVLDCLCWSAPPLRGGQMRYCRGLCFGVSFEDTSLSTLPSFLCHTGGFFCSLPRCLLIRLSVASNLSYLFFVCLYRISQSILVVLWLIITSPEPMQPVITLLFIFFYSHTTYFMLNFIPLRQGYVL